MNIGLQQAEGEGLLLLDCGAGLPVQEGASMEQSAEDALLHARKLGSGNSGQAGTAPGRP